MEAGPSTFVAPPPAPPRRRTRRQRAFLTLGVIVTAIAVGAAAVVGWGAWKLRSIDREDLALDDLIDAGPSNYLIVGSDTRAGGDPNDPGAKVDHKPLADTIMILRVDPGTKEAKVLSLPRDLWVTIAGTGQQGRINAAYAAGHQQLIDTLRNQLQIPINHYVEVDFKGFQQIVTAIDGVPMWFDRAMRDRNSGLDVLHPGCTTLDGYGALAFARARHLEYYENGGFSYDGTGDLGRITRQQVFMRRTIDRAKEKGIRNPLVLKRLIDVATGAVTIDDSLSVTDMAALGKRFADFDSKALQTYTVPTTPRTTSGGAAVLDLKTAEAQPVLDLFRQVGEPDDASTTTAAAVSATTLPPGDVVVTVLNASGRQGLAATVGDQLAGLGFGIDRTGNGADLGHASEDRTIVRYSPGSDHEAETVAAAVRPTARLQTDSSLPDGAVVLFLGADFTGIGSGTTASAAGSSSSSSTATTTTAVPQAEPKGMAPPGDPPPGRSCP